MSILHCVRLSLNRNFDFCTFFQCDFISRFILKSILDPDFLIKVFRSFDGNLRFFRMVGSNWVG
jgi:hypothetical protein